MTIEKGTLWIQWIPPGPQICPQNFKRNRIKNLLYKVLI